MNPAPQPPAETAVPGTVSVVAVIDAPGGGYVDDPDIERRVLAGYANVGLEIIYPDDRERLYEIGADYLILWHRVGLDGAFFKRAKNCRAVVCASVGYDHVDLSAARAADIPVFHIPHYGTEEVADHTLALALALVRSLPGLQRHVADGGWDWRVIGPVPRLRGLTWGVIGLGRIGTAVVQRARAFGVRCGYHDPGAHPGIEKALGIQRYATLPELLRASDIVSVHVPLDDSTHHLLGAAELRLLKPGSVLVNTARGPVLDIDALPAALDAGRPGRIGLDVVEGEPDVPPWLRTDPRALVTPHAAFYSTQSLAELRTRAAEAVAQMIRDQAVTSAFPVV